MTTAVSVVVATCRRPTELAQCLASLLVQAHQPARVVVVDDAPGGSETPELVAALGRPMVYVPATGAGLAAAHNRGLSEVETPVVAFTDDDVVADARWLEHLVAPFADPSVGCVTGRIVARELQTTVQRWLDGYAGYDKGPRGRRFDLRDHRPDDPLFPFAAGALGSGANMAFAAGPLRAMGGFDPALGAGTAARGGDDLSAFFEVICRGRSLVYEPAAIVRHRHARDYAALRRQVYGYGVGLTAYLTKCALDHPRLLPAALARLPQAALHLLGSRSPRNARRPAGYPAELIRLERRGMLRGPLAYLSGRRAVGRTAERAI